MQLIHVKLKNGEDLLGYLTSSTDTDIEINTPIAIAIEPSVGFFAKSWLLLSELNSVRLSRHDYMFYSNASDKAIEYYEEFMHRLNDKHMSDDTELNNELEDMFTAMIESKGNTKH